MISDLSVFINARPPIHFERAIAMRESRDHHVVKDRQVRENLWRLENARHPRLIDLMRCDTEQRLSVEHHRARIRRQTPDEAVKQRRFASTIRPNDRMNTPLFDGQVHVVKSLQTAKTLIDVADL